MTVSKLLKKSLVTPSGAAQFSKKTMINSSTVPAKYPKREGKRCKLPKRILALKLKSLNTKTNECVQRYFRLRSHTPALKDFSRLLPRTPIQSSLARRQNIQKDNRGSFSALSKILLFCDNTCSNSIRTASFLLCQSFRRIKTTKTRMFCASLATS